MMVIHFVRNGQGGMGMDAEQDVKWRGQTGGAILIYGQVGISVGFVCDRLVIVNLLEWLETIPPNPSISRIRTLASPSSSFIVGVETK